MLLMRTGEPAVEPVDLAAAKAHLRVLHSSEDAVITRAVKTARMHIENRLSRAFVEQQWKLWLPAFPRARYIQLPRPPLLAVESVSHIDAAGETQTLDAALYHVIAEGLFGHIELKAGHDWPTTGPSPKAVEIVFTAGYGETASAVPDDIVSAVLLLTEHFYFNRGETGDQALTVNPFGVDALLAPYRTHGWI